MPDVSALKERSPEALDALVRENTETLYNAARGMGFAETDAEELVQDSFVAFLDALDRFEGRSSVRTFLFGILYNKASAYRRRRLKEAPEEEVDARFDARFDVSGLWSPALKTPDEEALDRELREHLAGCAEGLTEAQRLAFHLKEVEGTPNEELCNVLGVSATNLRVILFRARNKLRDCLEQRWLGKAS
ncbi:sigma-70 family RNA polymerase sigma factor [bacterium]|nr:MAG: sigma-70 family RNA polymerase sigma factor [bacterium]